MRLACAHYKHNCHVVTDLQRSAMQCRHLLLYAVLNTLSKECNSFRFCKVDSHAMPHRDTIKGKKDGCLSPAGGCLSPAGWLFVPRWRGWPQAGGGVPRMNQGPPPQCYQIPLRFADQMRPFLKSQNINNQINTNIIITNKNEVQCYGFVKNKLFPPCVVVQRSVTSHPASELHVGDNTNMGGKL